MDEVPVLDSEPPVRDAVTGLGLGDVTADEVDDVVDVAVPIGFPLASTTVKPVGTSPVAVGSA